ncbi:hypothetical protein [Methylobacterium oxalidis]|uniref:hypothetical protein n=1 Tax=Methylobacterium oxalidis TaxID=944322 RepID=UPI003316191D
MRALAFLALILVLPLPAAAEDFTGFYAGVNAGYALGRDRESDLVSPNGSGPSAGAPGIGLPPSAVEAARTMREGRAGTRSDRVPR